MYSDHGFHLQDMRTSGCGSACSSTGYRRFRALAIAFFLLFATFVACTSPVLGREGNSDPATSIKHAIGTLQNLPTSNEYELASQYTFRPRNMVVVLGENGELVAHDFFTGRELWRVGAGDATWKVKVEQMPSRDTILHDPLALPFAVRGNELFMCTAAPLKRWRRRRTPFTDSGRDVNAEEGGGNLYYGENDEGSYLHNGVAQWNEGRSDGDVSAKDEEGITDVAIHSSAGSSSLLLERPLCPFFFMNVSTLLRRQAVKVGGADIYTTTSVNVADIDGTTGRLVYSSDVVIVDRNKESYGAQGKHEQWRNGSGCTTSTSTDKMKARPQQPLRCPLNQLSPLLHVVRYDITIHAYKPGAYKWSITLSQFRFSERNAGDLRHISGEDYNTKDTDSSGIGGVTTGDDGATTPRFFSHIVRDLLRFDESTAGANMTTGALTPFFLSGFADAKWDKGVLEEHNITKIMAFALYNSTHAGLWDRHAHAHLWLAPISTPSVASAYIWLSQRGRTLNGGGPGFIARLPVLRLVPTSKQLMAITAGAVAESTLTSYKPSPDRALEAVAEAETALWDEQDLAADAVEGRELEEYYHYWYMQPFPLHDYEMDDNVIARAAYHERNVSSSSMQYLSRKIVVALGLQLCCFAGSLAFICAGVLPRERLQRAWAQSDRNRRIARGEGAAAELGGNSRNGPYLAATRTPSIRLLDHPLQQLAYQPTPLFTPGTQPASSLQSGSISPYLANRAVAAAAAAGDEKPLMVGMRSPSRAAMALAASVTDTKNDITISPMTALMHSSVGTLVDPVLLPCSTATMDTAATNAAIKGDLLSTSNHPLDAENGGEEGNDVVTSHSSFHTGNVNGSYNNSGTLPMPFIAQAPLNEGNCHDHNHSEDDDCAGEDDNDDTREGNVNGSVYDSDTDGNVEEQKDKDEDEDNSIGEQWWMNAHDESNGSPLPMRRSISEQDSSVSLSNHKSPVTGATDGRLFQLHFKVIEKIGFGAEGCVFLVEHRVTGAKYAIKSIHIHERDESRVVQEAVLHSSFDHANVVRFYFCWIERLPRAAAEALDLLDNDDGMDTLSATYLDGNNSVSFSRTTTGSDTWSCADCSSAQEFRMLFIQMEYFPYGTLANELQTRKKIVRLENLQYMKQLADGLAYLHNLDVIHRDMKPTNIFVAINGNGCNGVGSARDRAGTQSPDRPNVSGSSVHEHNRRATTKVLKIGDFGLAKQRAAATLSSTTDLSSNVLGNQQEHSIAGGTPLYCSPEQENGREAVNKPSDIFSFGIIAVELYSMFSTDHERILVLTEARRQELQDELWEAYPQEAELIKSMLAESPSKRPDARRVTKVINRLIVSLDSDDDA